MALRPEAEDFARFSILRKVDRMVEFGYQDDYEFAKDKGVSNVTLCTWKKDARFKKMKKEIKREIAEDRIPNIIHVQADKADAGDTQAAKLVIEYAGELVQKHEFGVSKDDVQILLQDFIEILHDEVKDKRLLNRIANRLKEKTELM